MRRVFHMGLFQEGKMETLDLAIYLTLVMHFFHFFHFSYMPFFCTHSGIFQWMILKHHWLKCCIKVTLLRLFFPDFADLKFLQAVLNWINSHVTYIVSIVHTIQYWFLLWLCVLSRCNIMEFTHVIFSQVHDWYIAKCKGWMWYYVQRSNIH